MRLRGDKVRTLYRTIFKCINYKRDIIIIIIIR